MWMDAPSPIPPSSSACWIKQQQPQHNTKTEAEGDLESIIKSLCANRLASGSWDFCKTASGNSGQDRLAPSTLPAATEAGLARQTQARCSTRNIPPGLECELGSSVRNVHANRRALPAGDQLLIQAVPRQIPNRSHSYQLVPEDFVAVGGGNHMERFNNGMEKYICAMDNERITCSDAPHPNEVPSSKFTASANATTMSQLQVTQAETLRDIMSGLLMHRTPNGEKFTNSSRACENLPCASAMACENLPYARELGSQGQQHALCQAESIMHGLYPAPGKGDGVTKTMPSWLQSSAFTTSASDGSDRGGWPFRKTQRNPIAFPHWAEPTSATGLPNTQPSGPPQTDCFENTLPLPGFGVQSFAMSPQHGVLDNMLDDADIDDQASSDEEATHSWQFPKQIGYTGPKTTYMVRNIPVLYTQDMLLTEWPNNNTYDFLYLPYSCNMQRNLTYAFVNFTSEAAACEFKNKWHKARLAHYMARKPLNISCADLQGRDDNLLQLKRKRFWRIKVKQCQPIIYEKGKRVSLVEALRKLGQ